ncbi:MAG: cytochrome b/b6 domain-containing protein [Bacteroidales bacterium]|jgi:thiosulfate reductase cytochrome b subunit|nr:cytochrome b/b6 domain-containing protein [Bacteroidales bacterium]
MSEKVYLYPVWIRLWHWFNAILCLLLIVTGVSMQYSDPAFPMIRFDWAVSIHDISGIILAINYILFTIGNLTTSNGKHYIFRKKILKNLIVQARFYAFGIFKGEDPPFPITEKSKFNPLQKFSYIVIMHAITPIVIISGIMLFFPELISFDIFGSGALHITDILHVIMGFIISIFLVVHIYFCTIGRTPVSNFKSMFTGFHEKH